MRSALLARTRIELLPLIKIEYQVAVDPCFIIYLYPAPDYCRYLANVTIGAITSTLKLVTFSNFNAWGCMGFPAAASKEQYPEHGHTTHCFSIHCLSASLSSTGRRGLGTRPSTRSLSLVSNLYGTDCRLGGNSSRRNAPRRRPHLAVLVAIARWASGPRRPSRHGALLCPRAGAQDTDLYDPHTLKT